MLAVYRSGGAPKPPSRSWPHTDVPPRPSASDEGADQAVPHEVPQGGPGWALDDLAQAERHVVAHQWIAARVRDERGQQGVSGLKCLTGDLYRS